MSATSLNARKKEATPEPRPPTTPDEEVDEAARESFPASDPPSFTPLHPGSPGAHPDRPKKQG